MKEEGLSEEKLEELCGCTGMLLQCKLVEWIKEIQEVLVLDIKENNVGKYNKY